ncbi:hematopoietic cell signal transducer [Gracilinanus agilis]|uniref:hematopoietic cell signal transducer n=1 Tax=Gracilinanus agilis TaxID=191870 RepID=UPI001CFECE80|nr:hematopoietic cell signal transducer [Gracilinanus agilis]
MSPQVPTLLLGLLTVAAAQMSPDEPTAQDPNCGPLPVPLPLPILVGLVAADAVLSLLIAGAVFVCARPCRAPQMAEKNKVYVNMPGRG